MDLHPGAVFGRYTIESELGRGGMGRVLLATDGVLHRKVALKILLPGLHEKEEVVARFFREARLAAQLTHPNTVHVYDLGETGGLPFIAMEYVEGPPLTRFLGDPYIPAERRMRWLVDVAKGLGAAHARGLLHRDMKPTNVVISKEGPAKVVDFGLAKKQGAWPARHELPEAVGQVTTFFSRPTFQTATGFVVGTPAYMAPEQLDPTETIDARADQFAWAMTAYALILGKNLRKDDPLLFGPIPLLSDREPGIPRRAAEIVLRALSNDRQMRFPSMDALLAELEPALAVRPSGPPPRVSQPPIDSRASTGRTSQPPTPRMASAPPSVFRRFCPDCGLSLAMSSSRCRGPHAEAFPRPPWIEDDSTVT